MTIDQIVTQLKNPQDPYHADLTAIRGALLLILAELKLDKPAKKKK